jgi:hypothetical protein
MVVKIIGPGRSRGEKPDRAIRESLADLCTGKAI